MICQSFSLGLPTDQKGLNLLLKLLIEISRGLIFPTLLPGLGLNRTGQDRTPNFAGQVLPDWTESGNISLISPNMYGLSIII